MTLHDDDDDDDDGDDDDDDDDDDDTVCKRAKTMCVLCTIHMQTGLVAFKIDARFHF